MKISVEENSVRMGEMAAHYCTDLLHKAIELKGKARMIISTGSSLNTTLKALTASPIDWSKVEIFQITEFIGFSDKHPNSFKHYLNQSFIHKVSCGAVHYIHANEAVAEVTRQTDELRRDSIDLALVSIGDNASIAFNDPPANFTSQEAYHVVNIDLSSKMELVRDGRFRSITEIPDQVITMSVHQIMQCENIVTCEPSEAKAYAVMATIENEVSPIIPATILKKHPDGSCFLTKAPPLKLPSPDP